MIPPPEAAAAHPVTWMVYASQGRLKAPRHIRWLGEQVMRLVRGESLRLVVSCPPRHGKSVFLAEHLTSWWLGRHPDQRVIYVTMQERFSRSWGRKSRDAFFAHGQQLWGCTTWSRSSTAEWEVLRDGRRTGGSMSSVGAGGTITGKGAHLLVVDDLIRNLAEAQSETLRTQQLEWFQSAVLTRLEPNARVIILMTRWHHDDLIGRLMRLQAAGELGERWDFTNLPAISEGDGDPLGRPAGEALWPERYPVEVLKKRERDVGPYVWQSLYQGRPTPVSGAIFRKSWFRYYELGPKLATLPEHGVVELGDLLRFCTVDLAASKRTEADWTVIATWGYWRRANLLLLLDVERARYGGHEVVPVLRRAQEAHRTFSIFAEREGKLLEHKLGSVLKEAVRQGVSVVELHPEGDKIARAIAATGAFAAGQVWFPERAPWLGPLEEELLTFPEAAHDDQVDAATYAVGIFRELVARYAPRPVEAPREAEGGWDYGRR